MRLNIYCIPCKPGAIYIPITAECTNYCRFCISRVDGLFFGYDINRMKFNSPREVSDTVKNMHIQPKEIVFCGFGEPMLNSTMVNAGIDAIRQRWQDKVAIRIDTNGLSDIDYNTLLKVNKLFISLNAENKDKYEYICRPKIKNAYYRIINFMTRIAEFKDSKHSSLYVRCTAVEINENGRKCLPKDGNNFNLNYAPDMDKCKTIANAFGFDFVAKHLFCDSAKPLTGGTWNPAEFEDKIIRGEDLEECNGCSFRHV